MEVRDNHQQMQKLSDEQRDKILIEMYQLLLDLHGNMTGQSLYEHEKRALEEKQDELRKAKIVKLLIIGLLMFLVINQFTLIMK